MDTTILAAMIAGFITILATLLVLHSQNRAAARKKDDTELLRDNRLAILLENFPPHRHDSNAGINYPSRDALRRTALTSVGKRSKRLSGEGAGSFLLGPAEQPQS